MTYVSNNRPRTSDPRTGETGYDPWTAGYKSPYTYINIALRLDYFVKAAAAYNPNLIDRKIWLTDQLSKLQQAGAQYETEATATMKIAATLDGKSDIATWLNAIGGIAIATSNPIGLIGGAVMIAIGTVSNIFEKKSDTQSAKLLAEKIKVMQAEYTQLQALHVKYTNELNLRKYGPLLLYGTAAYIIAQ